MRIVETKRKRKRGRDKEEETKKKRKRERGKDKKKTRIQRLYQIFYSTQTSFPKKKKKEIINLFY